MRWGLVPPWAGDIKIGRKMINARAETIAEKRSFKTPLKQSRCIVPALGFYEWKKLSDGSKQPYFIRRKDNALMGLAGIYEKWQQPNDNVVFTFSIITTTPNEIMEPIHNRMPAILQPDNEDLWLKLHFDDVPTLQKLLHPYPADQLEAYPISTAVNNPANQGRELTKPAK
jgi:putative SOS response-associated peptidase YedK